MSNIDWTQVTETNPATFAPLKRWQFKAQLKLSGYKASVQAIINAMPDGKDKAVAEAKLEDADEYLIDDPLMQAIRAALGISVADFEAMWAAAEALE